MNRKTKELDGAGATVKFRPGRTRWVLFSFALIVLLHSPNSDSAGKSWFTGVTKDGQTRPISALTVESPDVEARGVSVSLPSTPTLINLTVSIYLKEGRPDYPKVYDDGNTQGNAGSA